MKEMHHAPVTDSGAGIRVKPEPVHKMSGKKGAGGGTGESGARVTCYRCGKAGHLANVCRFRDSVCHKCKKRGHLASVCRGKQQGSPSPPAKKVTLST